VLRSGPADRTKRGQIDTADLDRYLKERVPALAAQLEGKPEQTPHFFKGREAETYTLAVIH
jgi:hypothetical protein